MRSNSIRRCVSSICVPANLTGDSPQDRGRRSRLALGRAEALYRLGRYEDAINRFDEIWRGSPGNTENLVAGFGSEFAVSRRVADAADGNLGLHPAAPQTLSEDGLPAGEG